MKKILFLCIFLLAVCFLIWPTTSMAVSMYGDDFIASTFLEDELAWINSIPGFDFSSDEYKTIGPLGPWENITSEIYAYDLGFKPVYFLLKTESNPAIPDMHTRFLFLNHPYDGDNGGDQWAVIDFDDVRIGIDDPEEVTSIGLFGGRLDDTLDGSPVPEPATLLLFGSGLIGLVALKRKYY